MNKKGDVNDINTGDAAINTTNTFTFIKILVAIIVATMFLIIPTVRLINSRVPVPIDLSSDLILARLSNVCFVENHEPFEIKDQKIIQERLFNDDSLKNCFSDLSSLKISSIHLIWRDGDKINKKYLNMSLSSHKKLTLNYVIVESLDGSKHFGTLSVVR